MSTRRHFLSATAGATALAPLLRSQTDAVKPKSANDLIQIALIGCGGMGQNDARSSVASGMTKVVAACDCYDGRLQHMKEQYGADIFTTKDYTEILARNDIDAVLIGTPDHWHQKVTVDALRSKKDVYCEKPMVQHVEDGQAVVAAQKETKQILQIGSQRVSSIVYKKAQELYRAGAIGELNMVEAWWDRNSAVGAWEYTVPPDASTATCDWNTFQGRAPKTEWDPHRFFRWRCYRDYGTGVAGDLFVHLFSGLHFITGAIGPTRIFSTGGLRFWKDGRNVPDVLFGAFDYPKTVHHPAFNLILRVNFVSGAGENYGLRMTGSKGIMMVGDDVRLSTPPPQKAPGYTIGTFSEPMQKAFLAHYHERYPQTASPVASLSDSTEQVFSPPPKYSDHLDHHRNFALAIRSRKPVTEDAVFGLRAAGPALLANLSYFENRIVEWDPSTMSVKA
ncbi:MAG TPA: Gfo/Idh/MocA family oxidoreductase [Bryobacteraceae bacterium]|nr:Gfo/Idh/MocA family oxidoreductase [Bryobacteraceae bacterium]